MTPQRLAVERLRTAQGQLRRAVAAGRAAGLSWDLIAHQLGDTRKAAQRRYRWIVNEDPRDPLGRCVLCHTRHGLDVPCPLDKISR